MEYDSLSQIESNRAPSFIYNLPHNYYGTGHVVYQGSFYYHSFNASKYILRYDLHLKRIVSNYTLNVMKNDSDPRSCRVYSAHREHVGCVDLSVVNTKKYFF